ncbi:MAG: efflux RND transporter periplasmic adaptor subunit [Paludibacteraceae bacterium]|nr:efflux RND transporter periplasmic adaptor subunit [Bacteroidales bacterium]MCQ2331172.1 efflux RND transporter periplasmic adaptor subunit [Paludibacteraceae bacterium]
MANQQQEQKQGNMMLGLIILFSVIIIVALIGILAVRPEPMQITGEAEAAEYRVSGKVPGRIEQYLVEEGDFVHEGDTLVVINSPEVQAKLEQAQAARAAAQAQNEKAQNGARAEQIQGAYELFQKAKAGEEVYRKSFERVQRLHEQGVISTQKYDETEAQYKVAVANRKAAESQYNMALKGARVEDQAAAKAMVERVDGVLHEVHIAQQERYLLSPIDGEVADIFPKRGELVGQGSPVMSIVDMTDLWFHFAIREDMLKDIALHSEFDIKIPALGEGTWRVKVTYIKVMASYATWRATQTNGGYDVKTFDVKARPMGEIPANLRPGMTAIIVR